MKCKQEQIKDAGDPGQKEQKMGRRRASHTKGHDSSFPPLTTTTGTKPNHN